jgi:uncharacterized protein
MPGAEIFTDLTTADAPVHGYLHRSASPTADCVILTHGAGANCQTPLLTALADAFCAAGWMALRCDLPFRQSRPCGPPPRGSAEHDQQGLRAAAVAMRRMGANRIFLGGHSYGGRQASMLAARDPQVAGALLLLSFPLHPPRQPAQLRSGHFPSLRVPAFVVHGMRDGFGTISEMEAALKLIPARTELLPISGAGHELMTKSNHNDLIAQITSKFLAFARSTVR